MAPIARGIPIDKDCNGLREYFWKAGSIRSRRTQVNRRINNIHPTLLERPFVNTRVWTLATARRTHLMRCAPSSSNIFIEAIAIPATARATVDSGYKRPVAKINDGWRESRAAKCGFPLPSHNPIPINAIIGKNAAKGSIDSGYMSRICHHPRSIVFVSSGLLASGSSGRTSPHSKSGVPSSLDSSAAR